MKRRALYFAAPRRVEVREEDVPAPGPGQARVRTLLSGVSAGTELLVYRGEAPAELAADASIAALGGTLRFPLKYGYSAVGRVEAVGAGVEAAWQDRLVFAFNPHESHFVAGIDALWPLPESVTPEAAVFLPNLETAVNLVMDGQPALGERVVVFGQGVVGLLTTALLSRFPLEQLVALDRHALRREWAVRLGADAGLDPTGEGGRRALAARLTTETYAGADLCYELTGRPEVLDEALAATGYHGRVVIGSWYGRKRAPLDLGGFFHRSRIRLLASQVSTIDPQWQGRWTKARRLQTALRMIEATRPASLLTHRFPVEQAAEAYALLDEHPERILQVVLTYG